MSETHRQYRCRKSLSDIETARMAVDIAIATVAFHVGNKGHLESLLSAAMKRLDKAFEIAIRDRVVADEFAALERKGKQVPHMHDWEDQ